MSKHASQDRASLCLFACSDGRRCRMLRAADPYLRNCHARREAEDFARQKIGRNISSAFSGECVSATSLSIALARTLAATAQGQIKPKTSRHHRLSQPTIMQAVQHASHEYMQAWGTEAWRQAIRSCFGPPPQPSSPSPSDRPPLDPPCPQPEFQSAAQPVSVPEPAQPPSASTMTTPQPRPTRPPLPKDAATFADQVLSALKH